MEKKDLKHSYNFLLEYKKAIDESSIVSKTDKNGLITFVNKKFCEISGYEEDELIGKSHNIVRHPSMTKEFFNNLWKTITNKEIFKGVIVNKKKNGLVYYVDTTIIPILDENKNIEEFIAIRHDITKVYEQKKLIEEQFIDELTLLPNRQKLLKDLKDSKIQKIAMININSFRDINNFYGFEAGDLVLKKFSQILLDKISTNINLDLYRVANDVFAICTKNKDNLKEIRDICTNIIEYFSLHPILINNNSFYLSISIGVARNCKDSAVQNNLLSKAEYALRMAKKRDISILFLDENIELYNKLKENKKLIEELKNALISNNLLIYGQKLINNISKKEKYEILMRVKLEDGSILTPYSFLKEAKKAKLYLGMTRMLVKKACEYFKGKDIDFNLNLTLEDIKDQYTMDFIVNAMEKTNTAKQITFEIVESEGIESFTEVSNFIKKAKKLGCKIAIDDFGTGYSNFEYIIKLDVDYIKIDGSLIKNINTDNNLYLTVQTIVGFAKALKIKTVAEFVHNEEVLNCVKNLDIDYSQGFFIDEPKELA
ncbi:bifunctional diguanylate cyclase/phosphodiesterase [Aliarcobacter cryaerophilus]|uniref:EAL domain-containing protein n=3 Tax=Arcobacteraceae TaxID=2808963 RepID=A0AA96D1C8_9BACT|nr:EAL domain-containing protein [Aliarcobacter cryaerophilus]WNL13379.1 EAL domain-containing protein [Arcobacter sp. AZ-2023]WPD09864.1 EAL domain-containing protein [Arcobacter sp. DSM 115954]WNL14695.1 EAL domain-containing protein [Arcobacter sp. AZ-2023]WNL19422.1 EAL domain-containing protein [Arcobacter sp. AZ-2023]WNL21561.1 EAL domain-containing protein [Arcobacter sp. AZ-2023]